MAATEFSEFIECDLQNVARWLTRRNPRLGELFLDSVRDDVQFLARNPHAGPIRREFVPDNVRFWPISGFDSYLILYRVHPQHVEIWRVVHGARDFRKMAEEES